MQQEIGGKHGGKGQPAHHTWRRHHQERVGMARRKQQEPEPAEIQLPDGIEEHYAKLTPRQQRFVEGLALGLTGSDAYRRAGYADATPEAVATAVYRLRRGPHIAPILDALASEVAVKAVVGRRRLLERLEAVNKAAYERYTDMENPDASNSFKPFMESLSKLLEYAPNDMQESESWYQVAADEYRAQCGLAASVFPPDEAVWFRGGSDG